MKQSVLDAQEAYRRNQAAVAAANEAAKQPMNADQVSALTLRVIDQMPAEVYKAHMGNPAFVTKVNELAQAEPRKPR